MPLENGGNEASAPKLSEEEQSSTVRGSGLTGRLQTLCDVNTRQTSFNIELICQVDSQMPTRF